MTVLITELEAMLANPQQEICNGSVLPMCRWIQQHSYPNNSSSTIDVSSGLAVDTTYLIVGGKSGQGALFNNDLNTSSGLAGVAPIAVQPTGASPRMVDNGSKFTHFTSMVLFRKTASTSTTSTVEFRSMKTFQVYARIAIGGTNAMTIYPSGLVKLEGGKCLVSSQWSYSDDNYTTPIRTTNGGVCDVYKVGI